KLDRAIADGQAAELLLGSSSKIYRIQHNFRRQALNVEMAVEERIAAIVLVDLGRKLVSVGHADGLDQGLHIVLVTHQILRESFQQLRVARRMCYTLVVYGLYQTPPHSVAPVPVGHAP